MDSNAFQKLLTASNHRNGIVYKPDPCPTEQDDVESDEYTIVKVENTSDEETTLEVYQNTRFDKRNDNPAALSTLEQYPTVPLKRSYSVMIHADTASISASGPVLTKHPKSSLAVNNQHNTKVLSSSTCGSTLKTRKKVTVREYVYELPAADVPDNEAIGLLSMFDMDAQNMPLDAMCKLWGIASLYPPLIDNRVTDVKRLLRLEPEDINELTRIIGYRIILRDMIYYLKGRCTTPSVDSSVEPSKRATDIVYDPQFPDLQSFLCSSLTGQCIIKYYEAKHELDNTRRNEMVKIIILEAIKRNIKLNHAFFRSISSSINAIFPNEPMTIYFTPQSRIGDRLLAAGGKFIKRKGVILRSLEVPGDSESIDRAEEDRIVDREEQEEARMWLVEGRTPEAEVVEQWVKCRELRRKLFSELKSVESRVSMFPIVQESCGKSLLISDFESEHPGKLQNFYRSFPELHLAIGKHLESIKDNETRDKIGLYKNAQTEESKNVLLAFLLPALIPTNYRVSGTWRPSIKESLDGFILYVPKAEQMDAVIETRKCLLLGKSSASKELRLQSTVLVIGDINDPTYFVVCERLQYPVKSIVEAIGFAVVLTCTLNLRFNDDAKPIWLFIQQYLFQMLTLDTAKSTEEFIRKLRMV
ncbi:uncharacterized protein LOC131438320 [Malaya genurostris]|uniref:uncharacterized protein LOC131438320 n=1 Tax=Malaya genurostris TaxID=325434 RepID=UPI0026F3B6E0|nr:uncharacterized protein LOC131438320 [Malaya genurostris]XP_058464224.1 uncharacterized protein LOC131438320 [Malaya genurostris]